MLGIQIARKRYLSKRGVGGGNDPQTKERKRVKKNESGRRETARMAAALGEIGKHFWMEKPTKRDILVRLVDGGELHVSLRGRGQFPKG